jgi:Na+(H+)/acetate symporter ActP
MFKNIRFYVLICSLILVLIEYWVVLSFYTSERLQTIRLTQYFALTAITYLYLTLLIGPFVFVFHKIPFKNQLLKARRALGVREAIRRKLKGHRSVTGRPARGL